MYVFEASQWLTIEFGAYFSNYFFISSSIDKMQLKKNLPVVLALVILLLSLPVLSLFFSWFWMDAQAWQILQQMAQHLLPEYLRHTFYLAGGVLLLSSCIGVSTALCVSIFEFKTRKFWEWALLLPMAMPAYVLAYAYTDFFQFSGAFQNFLRESFALEGRLIPEIRSLPGAIVVLSLCLYPYIYLLTRSALTQRSPHLLDAAELLGLSNLEKIVKVILPLARPSIAVGMTLVLMETLADYGVTSYFGLTTFSTGIYKAWLVMDDKLAASQLASFLLMLIFLLLVLEKRAQQQLRFVGKGQRLGTKALRIKLETKGQFIATVLCALPLFFAFVLPVSILVSSIYFTSLELAWNSFLDWTLNSIRLAGIGSLLIVGSVLLLAYLQRIQHSKVLNFALQILNLGYVVPGAVLVVGLLMPIMTWQQHDPDLKLGYWITGTSLGILWIYWIRFSSVALQSVQGAYQGVPISLDESAQLLGVKAWSIFKNIHWPLLRPSVMAAGLLVVVDVMKELPATLVLRPFNSDTLAVAAYQLARDERLAEAAVPSLVLVAVGLLPVLLLSRSEKH